MNVKQFRETLPGAPPLPAELKDTDSLEQWLVSCFIHASRVVGFGDTWNWEVRQGIFRGDLKVKVAVDLAPEEDG